MLDSHPILGRKGPASPPADNPAQPVPDRPADPENETTTGGGGRWLCCRFCGLKITSPSTKASPNGRHRHTFANPHGYVFDVRCFASAPGAAPVGVFSAEFTWFAGYRWKVALCRRCQVHLGWVFQGSAGGFYALIGNRLRETSD